MPVIRKGRSRRPFEELAFLVPVSGSLALKGRLGRIEDGIKRCRVVDREIGEDLAVDLDAGSVEALHKSRIAQSTLSDGSADALNPESPELPLPLLAVVVFVLTGLVDRILCVAVEFGAESPESLGSEQDAFTSFATGWAVGGAWHVSVFLERTVSVVLPQSHPFVSRVGGKAV